MNRRLIVALLSWLATSRGMPAEEPSAAEWQAGSPIALFSGVSLQHWVPERISQTRTESPIVANGALRLTADAGWLRTATTFRDFRLSLTYRATEGSKASVFFRTWPGLDGQGVPLSGYAAVISPGDQPEQWHELVLEVKRKIAEISIDNVPTKLFPKVTNPIGYVGLRSEAGEVDVRDIRLIPLRLQETRAVSDVQRPGVDGLENPRVLKEARPAYAADAMRERVAGAVRMEVVVRVDGTVGDVRVVESLDARLDEEAANAAKQWRFHPGTLNGTPVPVLVTIEMTFTLK